MKGKMKRLSKQSDGKEAEWDVQGELGPVSKEVMLGLAKSVEVIHEGSPVKPLTPDGNQQAKLKVTVTRRQRQKKSKMQT